MNSLSAVPERRFYRDADRALLGGVCAGIANYLGFNLCVTRFLAVIAFLMIMPVAIVAYFAIVFLVPSYSRKNYDFGAPEAKKKKQQTTTPRSEINDTISRRCKDLDERLARLEKHVTSRKFQLDQELRRL